MKQSAITAPYWSNHLSIIRNWKGFCVEDKKPGSVQIDLTNVSLHLGSVAVGLLTPFQEGFEIDLLL